MYVYFFLSYKKRITSIEDKKERKDETLSAMFPEKIFLFFTCVPFFFHFWLLYAVFIILFFFLSFFFYPFSFAKIVRYNGRRRLKREFFRRSIDGITTQTVRVIFQGPMTREVITVISPNPGRDMGFSVWKFSLPPGLLCQEVIRD